MLKANGWHLELYPALMARPSSVGRSVLPPVSPVDVLSVAESRALLASVSSRTLLSAVPAAAFRSVTQRCKRQKKRTTKRSSLSLC